MSTFVFMSVENHFFFTYQVDDFFSCIHEAKTIFSNILFTQDLLVNPNRYLSKQAFQSSNITKRYKKSTYINQNKNIFFYPHYRVLLGFQFSKLNELYCNCKYRIGGVMVSVNVCSSPGWVMPKTMKWVCVASPLITQHSGERAKTVFLGFRIMCPSGATCLTADCCFRELAL